MGGEDWNFRFFGFGVHSSLQIFRFYAFDFRKNTNGFSDLVFDVVLGFPYLRSGFSCT